MFLKIVVFNVNLAVGLSSFQTVFSEPGRIIVNTITRCAVVPIVT